MESLKNVQVTPTGRQKKRKTEAREPEKHIKQIIG